MCVCVSVCVSMCVCVCVCMCVCDNGSPLEVLALTGEECAVHVTEQGCKLTFGMCVEECVQGSGVLSHREIHPCDIDENDS